MLILLAGFTKLTSFGYYQTPIAEKLLIASFHMELEALIWFHEAEEARVFSDWESLVQAF